MELFISKARTFNHQIPLNIALNITNIIGFKKTADRINNIICNMLLVNEDKYLISMAIDFINGQQYNSNELQKLFKNKTNLPSHLRLQQGACVMYLKNNLIEQKICNRTVGVITDIKLESLQVRVAFSIIGGIVDIEIKKEITTFIINGKPSSQSQFPLQNAFALTVHKT